MCDACDPTDCSPPGSSVHGILQARTLEWVAISFSRGSSRPRDRTQVSCIAGGFFTNSARERSPDSLGSNASSTLSRLCGLRQGTSLLWASRFLISTRGMTAVRTPQGLSEGYMSRYTWEALRTRPAARKQLQAFFPRSVQCPPLGPPRGLAVRWKPASCSSAVRRGRASEDSHRLSPPPTKGPRRV